MHQKQQAPPAAVAAALGLLALPLAAKRGPARGWAGGPEGVKLAPTASQLQLLELGHGSKVQIVRQLPPCVSFISYFC